MKTLYKMLVRGICLIFMAALMIGFTPTRAVAAEPEFITIAIVIEVDGRYRSILCDRSYNVWYVHGAIPNVEFAIYRDGNRVTTVATDDRGIVLWVYRNFPKPEDYSSWIIRRPGRSRYHSIDGSVTTIDQFTTQYWCFGFYLRLLRADGYYFDSELMPLEFHWRSLLYTYSSQLYFRLYPYGHIPSPRRSRHELRRNDGWISIEGLQTTTRLYGDGVTVTVENESNIIYVRSVRGYGSYEYTVVVLYVPDLQDDIIVKVEDWVMEEMYEAWVAERQRREENLQYEIEWHEMMGLDFDKEAFLAESMASWYLNTLFFIDSFNYDYFENDIWMPRQSPKSGWSQWYDDGVFVIPAEYLRTGHGTINEFRISGLHFFVSYYSPTHIRVEIP